MPTTFLLKIRKKTICERHMLTDFSVLGNMLFLSILHVTILTVLLQESYQLTWQYRILTIFLPIFCSYHGILGIPIIFIYPSQCHRKSHVVAKLNFSSTCSEPTISTNHMPLIKFYSFKL